MSQIANLSREVALRIALAARLLPDVGISRLLEILHRRISEELTEESLKLITVTDLKRVLPVLMARRMARILVWACRH